MMLCSRHLDNLSLRENSEASVGPLNTVRKVVVPLVEDSMVCICNISLSPCRSLYGSVGSSFRFLSFNTPSAILSSGWFISV